MIANPHFPWIGGERFWESHIDVPGIYDVIGASLWGSPLISIGHNQHVGWTHTVSTNITTTNLTLNSSPATPPNISSTASRADDLPGRDGAGARRRETRAQTHRFYYSKYGPIISSPAWTTTTATAFNDGNATTCAAGDQWLKIGQSNSSQELVKSEEEIQGMPWVNTIGSDDKGNAFYTEIAVTPNLPTTYLNGACNLSPTQVDRGPFDGSKSECELQSTPTRSYRDLRRLQRAEADPKRLRRELQQLVLAGERQPTADRLLPGPGQRKRQPGHALADRHRHGQPAHGHVQRRRADRRSRRDARVHHRNAAELVDVLPRDAAERALPGLREICENAVKNTGGVINNVNVSAACPILNAYDATAKLNSPGGWLFNRWWASAPTTNAAFWVNRGRQQHRLHTEHAEHDAGGEPERVRPPVTDLETRGIPLNASFGQVQYTQRATKIPIPGCSDGSNCFAVINSSYDNSTAKTSAVNGSSSSIVMFTELDPRTGPLTKGLLTYSQSEDITSPFYEDQTQRFSADEWITLPWTASQVSANAHLGRRWRSAPNRVPRLLARLRTRTRAGCSRSRWTGPDPAAYGDRLHAPAPQRGRRMDRTSRPG